MEKKVCINCQKQNAGLECGLCENPVCKKCAQFVADDHFSFLKEVSVELTRGTYCGTCFESRIYPEMAAYDDMMAKAKEVLVFFKTQSKETRLFSRKEKPLVVKDCKDRDETVMRLAFFAAQGGFNAIIDVDLKSEKVRDGSYQTQKWDGTAVPAQIDPSRIPKDRSIWQNPN